MRRPWTSAAGGRGVTFVEMLLVAAVLAVIALLALPTAHYVNRRLQEDQLRRALTQVRAAIDEYHRDWERGWIESPNELGWPETLEELTEPIDYTGPEGRPREAADEDDDTHRSSRFGRSQQLSRGLDQGLPGEQLEPIPKVYLPRIPRDPFNRYDDPWDTGGWCARSYEDEPDATSWSGDDVYDVRSCSAWEALDGTRYEEW